MPPTSNKAKLVTSAVIAVCVLAAAIAATYWFQLREGNALLQDTSRYSAEILKATTMVGTIDSTAGTTLILSVLVPAGSDLPQQRKVHTDAATVFLRFTPKNLDEYKQERAAYLKQAATASSSGALFDEMPPRPFIYENITLNDLRKGDSVEITATQPMYLLSQFTASEIKILPRP